MHLFHQKRQLISLVLLLVAVGMISETDALECYSCESCANPTEKTTCDGEESYCFKGDPHDGSMKRVCYPTIKGKCIQEVTGSNCFNKQTSKAKELFECIQKDPSHKELDTLQEGCICTGNLCNSGNSLEPEPKPKPRLEPRVPGFQCYNCTGSLLVDHVQTNCISSDPEKLKQYIVNCPFGICSKTSTAKLIERRCVDDAVTHDYGECIVSAEKTGCIKHGQKVTKSSLPCILNIIKGNITQFGRTEKIGDHLTYTVQPNAGTLCFCEEKLCNSGMKTTSNLKMVLECIGTLMIMIYKYFA